MVKTELKVLLYLKRNSQDKNGNCPLMGKITVKSEANSTAQFGCKIKVDPRKWNATSQRCTGKSKVSISTNKEIENMLLRLRTRFDELCNSGNPVKAEDVKNFSQAMASAQMTLMELVEMHNQEYSFRVGVNRSAASYVHYQRVKVLLSEFLKKKYKVSDMPLRSLNMEFIEAFDMFLHIEKKHKASTKLGHLKCLKAIMNDAHRRGYIPYNPFKGYSTEKPEEVRRHLSMDELKRIMSVHLDKPNQKITRDLFVFSCFTGICYCDLYNLTQKNIYKAGDGRFWIRTQRQKTGTVENVLLLDIPLSIIRKYQGMAADSKLFPMLTHGSVTFHLKKIAARCGISRNVTFHQARHSFASVICLSLGVPIETVSRIMGHKNITTTQHYAKVTYDKIDRDVSELGAGIKGKFSLNGIEMPPSTILKDMSRRVCRKTWKISPEKIQERKERKEREMKMKGEAV